MWPEVRALRGRGAAEEGLLARPGRPSRCTLPITALRVMPPSSAAIWLADSPSDHSFLRSSTRSSVQLMGSWPPSPSSESIPVRRAPLQAPERKFHKERTRKHEKQNDISYRLIQKLH